MRLVAVIGLVFALAAPLASGGPDHTQVHFRQIASGFDDPVYVTAPRNEPSNVYVVERPGRIRVLVNGRLRAQVFLDIRNLVGSGDSEQGLLGLAFDPSYGRNHRFFVYYTDKRGDSRVAQYRSNGTVGLPGTRRQLLFVDQPFSNHNGGELTFGPDGLLYLGLGDGGSGGDPGNRGQNLGTFLGKIIRKNVNRGSGWKVAAYGLRNPWRFSFDRSNGNLYIGDVGQGSWEEIDFRARGNRRLANYGWSVYEGRAKFKSASLRGGGQLVFPVAVYSHDNGDCSVTGGYVYRGSAVAAARGRYYYGDYCSGRLWSLRVSGGKATQLRRESSNVPSLSSFGEDARGELYAVSLDGGIYKIAP